MRDMRDDRRASCCCQYTVCDMSRTVIMITVTVLTSSSHLGSQHAETQTLLHYFCWILCWVSIKAIWPVILCPQTLWTFLLLFAWVRGRRLFFNTLRRMSKEWEWVKNENAKRMGIPEDPHSLINGVSCWISSILYCSENQYKNNANGQHLFN